MAENIDYTDVTFIPYGGKLHVDTCGLDWTPPRVDGRPSSIGRLEKLTAMKKELLKRSNINTAPLILEEIKSGIKYLKSVYRIEKRRKKLLKDDLYFRGERQSTPSEWKKEGWDYEETFDSPTQRASNLINYFKRAEKSYRKVYTHLKASMKKNFPEIPNDKERDILHFLNNKKFAKLSRADKQLMGVAIASGDESGILTADIPIMIGYQEAIKSFGLRGCFISDSIKHKTSFI